MNRFSRLLTSLLAGPAAAACALQAFPLAADAEPPLRYQFRAGDQLVYERRAEIGSLQTRQVRRRIVDQIQLWCFENRHGDALLLLDQIRIVAGQAAPMQGVVLRVDPRGERRVPDEMLATAATLETAFDLIPVLRLASEPGPQWLTPPDPCGQSWRCREVGPDAQHRVWVRVEFTLEDPTGAAEVLRLTRSGRFWFDPTAGIVTRVESTELDESSLERTDAVIVLRDRRQREPRWCTSRVDEAQHFLRAVRQEHRLLRELLARPAEEAAIMQRLERHWSAFGVDVDARASSPFAALSEGRKYWLAAEAPALRRRVAYAQHRLGKPAPRWSLQEPAGTTLASESFRGRPVLECFWSASEPWSLRMLATMRELPADLGARKDSRTSETQIRPQLLCLNLDADVELARRAAHRCGAGLTHVLAEPLRLVDEPPELPLLRMLDETGTVRAIFFGWQPSLASQIAALLDDTSGR